MPVRASKDDVGEIFRFNFAADTKLANMKRTVSADFMPDAPKRSVEGTAKAILHAVGATFQMPIALRAETGFHTFIRSLLALAPLQMTTVFLRFTFIFAAAGSYQDHVIDILTHRDMPACTLESLQKEGVQQLYASKSTACPQPGGMPCVAVT
eukprot:1035877-Amphidinium_carterae.1